METICPFLILAFTWAPFNTGLLAVLKNPWSPLAHYVTFVAGVDRVSGNVRDGEGRFKFHIFRADNERRQLTAVYIGISAESVRGCSGRDVVFIERFDVFFIIFADVFEWKFRFGGSFQLKGARDDFRHVIALNRLFRAEVLSG